MFDTDSPEQLVQLFDHFSVPMFAAERKSSERDFTLICINSAHEKAAGLARDDIQGNFISDILPAKEAAAVNLRYTTCADSHQDLRYKERLSMGKGVQKWDTSLQPIRLSDGRERIIGTSFLILQEEHQLKERVVFDDIQYFSSIADLQLQNLLTVFETATSDGLFSHQNTQRVAKLSGICRTVQRAVFDIKQVVQKTNAQVEMVGNAALLEKSADASEMLEEVGGSTLRALYESTLEQRHAR